MIYFAGDPIRQTAIAQQMERKQRELMEAKRQEEQLLAEADNRRSVYFAAYSNSFPFWQDIYFTFDWTFI